MEGQNFVLICNPTWELKIGSNIRNMALELSKKNNVLYVNPPLDRKIALTEKDNADVQRMRSVVKGTERDLTQLSEKLWLLQPSIVVESINWIPFTTIFKIINKVNSRRYAKSIQSAIERLGFSEFYLINDSLMFRGYDLKELLKPKLYIYYIRDYLVSQPYFKRHGAQMEPELMANSDLVLANSVFLKNFAATYCKNSYYIGQGYENQLFEANGQYNIPEDIENIGSPRIGYIGTLTHLRLDEQLLINLAKKMPDHHFIFVGPEDDVFRKSELHELNNVYFLGLKKMNELAAYVKYFDVAINPQLVNDLTIGNYPLKIDEYLSMGKPTVATQTEAMEAFSEYTYLASDPADYPALIRKAIEENSDEKEVRRIEFARQHTWENCIHEVYRNISRIDAEKNQSITS